jgi:hypothetical protein
VGRRELARLDLERRRLGREVLARCCVEHGHLVGSLVAGQRVGCSQLA